MPLSLPWIEQKPAPFASHHCDYISRERERERENERDNPCIVMFVYDMILHWTEYVCIIHICAMTIHGRVRLCGMRRKHRRVFDVHVFTIYVHLFMVIIIEGAKLHRYLVCDELFFVGYHLNHTCNMLIILQCGSKSREPRSYQQHTGHRQFLVCHPSHPSHHLEALTLHGRCAEPSLASYWGEWIAGATGGASSSARMLQHMTYQGLQTKPHFWLMIWVQKSKRLQNGHLQGNYGEKT